MRATDYISYKFTLKDNIRYSLEGVICIIIFGELFYDSVLGILFISPIVFLYRRQKKIILQKERKWKLNLEFRDGLISLSAALNAGYSAERSFEESIKELRNLYTDKSLIIKEFNYLVNQIRMNITVEKALTDFGKRSGVEDIISFAEVFATAKRTGGDLIKVIKTTCNTISNKIEVKREIITLISAKRFEAGIMKIIPVGILCYLRISSPGYLNPLYHNLFGIIIMTLLLGTYLGAYLLIQKIIDIEV